MSEYLVVVEKAEHNYAAYSPEIPACLAKGDTKEETLKLMHEAIALHLKALQEEGLPIPQPSTSAEYLAV